jgi:hypothetical protein
MYNRDFGQAYCKDLLKGIPENFTLYFSEFAIILYKVWNFQQFHGIKKPEKISEK